MGDLGRAEKELSPQLPVNWYFDAEIFAREQERLFAAGPGYVGHQLMAPETGDYRSLAAFEHGRLLFNDGTTHWSLSNVCRHRQAIMLQGAGRVRGNIVCPVHRWSYETDGTLRAAPHFPQNPCLNLDRQALASWNGLLFSGPRSPAADLAGMHLAAIFDFSGYRLGHVEEHLCHYNWKTFIEVYLEDYHVLPFHPGLGHFVTCNDLSWQFGDWYSVQRVGLGNLKKPGSAAYARWQQAVQARYDNLGTLPAQGAVWLTYYPNVMVEWYPQVLIVSTLVPQAVDRTLNIVEFYYPEDLGEGEREFIAAERAAYMETAIEDDEIAERMDRGRRVLMRAGRNEVGPYQSPMEDGMRHFHGFYRRQMGLEGV